MEILQQSLGWIGAGLVIIAYFLVSTKKVERTNKVFQLLNFFGAVGVGINAFHQQAWPSFAIQIVWGIIAVLALSKARRS